MQKAIRIECFQNLVNYRKPSSFIIKESYPLPPYSTVLGMVHAVCGYPKGDFHPMKLSIQGTNAGSVSELYTRYSFNMNQTYENGRHQICIQELDRTYGVFKGIAHVELICRNEMILHIIPLEKDFDTVYQCLKNPLVYPALGRHEDLLDIQNVEIVELREEKEAIANKDIYIPVNMTNYIYEEDTNKDLPTSMHTSANIRNKSVTVYTLTKEYEITKQGMRRWKKEGGKIKVHYFPHGEVVENILVDTYGDVVALA